MSERTCEGCRWWRYDLQYYGKPHGVCRRNPPVGGEFPDISGDSMCGEWQDKSITPKEHERRELVRRFALAIVEGVYANPDDVDVHVMLQAKQYADRFIEAMKEGQV